MADPASSKPDARPGQPAAPAAAAAKAPGMRIVEDDVSAGLLALLKVEAEAREAATPDALRFLIANETRKLTRARQVFVLTYGVDKASRVTAVSGLAAVDRSVPLVRAVEAIVARIADEVGLDKVREFEATAYAAATAGELAAYPFKAMLWLPFKRRDGSVAGGMLLAREDAWGEANALVAKRLAGTFAHALSELSQRPRLIDKLFNIRKAVAIAAAAALAALAIPVSLTALAPFEMAPRDPFVVAAPIEGIVEEILVEPNQTVAVGQPLVRFSDTMLRNKLAVAERELLVADARVKKATQLAFSDPRGRQELRIAMSELELKTAERDFAADMLARADVKATRAGIAVFADKKQMIGRPVQVGERLMLIADPQAVEAQIDLAVGDSIALKSGAKVKLFLDSDPLRPRHATLAYADYQARARPGNQLAFRIVADLADPTAPPRLGVRGTAQIYGDKVPLAFTLFRRPLSAVRQWIGL